MVRVRAYIDGYNLYHAIVRLRTPHLKWVDLWALCNTFVPPKSAELVGVHYSTAYAHWLPRQMARHEIYVAAQEARGVTVHLAKFKTKDRKCPKCGHTHRGHEEKETDVHIALSLLDHARQDLYDTALLVSRDSDLAPALRMTKLSFPHKDLRVVAPPGLGHSNELLGVADGKYKIQKKHLERCLLPQTMFGTDGQPIHRPPDYAPVAQH